MPKDVDSFCQQVLKDRLNPNGHDAPHVFLDMFHLLAVAGFVSPFDHVNRFQSPILLAQWFLACGGMAFAQCCGHGLWCPVPWPDIDVTGTPCQDWSGLGLKARGWGPQMKVFLMWCAIILAKAVPIVVHENVPQFPVSLLEAYLGQAYHVFSFVGDCADMGFGHVSRKRRYTVMYHKLKTCIMCSPVDLYSHVVRAMAGKASTGWSIADCFLADAAEVCEEIMPLRQKKNIHPDLAMANMQLLLSTSEARHLIMYMTRWMDRFGIDASSCPTAVFNLSDNPDHGYLTWSAASGRIPGLRTQGSKLWAPGLGRWLTTMELLAAMGVPVYPSLAMCAGLPLVQVSPGPRARHMLGNMMHIASVGAAMCVAMASVRLL